ncbi:MAG TPA: disulfide bond formation protein B [Xanthobacteraceae bacterium]|jgi:disulfide bond formation protein DsbB|nr:disulfide bond formation protein B [Xanthobacteraceae bacterium]
MSESTSSPVAAVLNRLILLAMLAVLAAILTAAMVMQYALGEIPCPLCLLQRVAMFGCAFGLIEQLRAGNSERGGGIALIFSVLLLVISVRQTLLDIYPRPGHDYIGSAVFGLHLPVWSVIIAVALLLGLAVRLALFGSAQNATIAGRTPPRGIVQPLAIYVAAICAINFFSVIAQCGLGQCHTFGYWLLQ